MIRAHVHEDVLPLCVAISIVQHPAEGDMDPRLRILRLPPAGDMMCSAWEEVPSPCVTAEPTFRLDHDAARALLDALTRHFHGAEDTRALRRDYDGERVRVDRLIEHLAVIGRNLTAPDGSPPARLEPVTGGRAATRGPGGGYQPP